MRYYQRKKNNPYRLEQSLYEKIVRTVKDYDRLLGVWGGTLEETPISDGMPRGKGFNDPTVSKVIRRENMERQLKAVEQAIFCIPEEFRDGIMHHVKYGVLFPDIPVRRTWFRYQAEFLYYVAILLGEI